MGVELEAQAADSEGAADQRWRHLWRALSGRFLNLKSPGPGPGPALWPPLRGPAPRALGARSRAVAGDSESEAVRSQLGPCADLFTGRFRLANTHEQSGRVGSPFFTAEGPEARRPSRPPCIRRVRRRPCPCYRSASRGPP